jgi:hypothetical protein
MEAPAFAAPTQASAISSGVTGSAGFCARVGKLPVTAQVKMGFVLLPAIGGFALVREPIVVCATLEPASLSARRQLMADSVATKS